MTAINVEGIINLEKKSRTFDKFQCNNLYGSGSLTYWEEMFGNKIFTCVCV